MRCDQFLSWLESGQPARVAAARRHAAGCVNCREAALLLDDVRQELAAHEPLPAGLRQAFLDAAASAKVELAAFRLNTAAPGQAERRWLGWALAASLAAAIACWALWPSAPIESHVGPQLAAGDQRRVSSIVVLTIDSREELEHLAGDLDTLRATFDEAMADAHRLAAQEAVERTLGDYQQLFAGRDAR